MVNAEALRVFVVQLPQQKYPLVVADILVAGDKEIDSKLFPLRCIHDIYRLSLNVEFHIFQYDISGIH